jgi:N-ethylmaleimide reductase
MAARYYGARSSAGLIITEATQVSARGQGYPDTPGIHTTEQIEAWRQVTGAVHERGGRIFVQLSHAGRLSHSAYHGLRPIAPSPIAPTGFIRTPLGTKEYEVPHALKLAEIAEVVEEFAAASRAAAEAGFDGVEIHGGQGFLIDQFLQSGTNGRTDRYGGGVENRAALALEILEAVKGFWETDRVAFLVSPGGNHKGIQDEHPIETFSYLARQLGAGIGFLHVLEQTIGELSPTVLMRENFRGALLSSEGYTMETAEAAVASGLVDLIAFGRAYTANPDLVERFREGRSLAYPDPLTFYSGGEAGYIDNLD